MLAESKIIQLQSIAFGIASGLHLKFLYLKRFTSNIFIERNND